MGKICWSQSVVQVDAMSSIPQLFTNDDIYAEAEPLKESNVPFPGAKVLFLKGSKTLEYGGKLPEIQIAYETYGTLSGAGDNVILLLPAFSAHSHACSTVENPERGWWESMVGPGMAIDTDRFFVVCPSLLGSCYGTTGPPSLHPQTERPFAANFPTITIRDIVDVHVMLLDHLGIEQVEAVVGGSMGAMQVVEMAVRYPHRMRRFVNISGTAHTRPYTAAVRHLGRRAIMFDPAYKNGNYGNVMPIAGLRLAREIGTLFYRGKDEFNMRFDQDPLRAPGLNEITFDVQSYLNHQGNKVVLHFDPNSYLFMSLSMDLHDIRRGFESEAEAYAQIQAEALTIGVVEDNLIPIHEQRDIHDSILRAGGKSAWVEVSSRIGHDAFLGDTKKFTPLVKSFLESS